MTNEVPLFLSVGRGVHHDGLIRSLNENDVLLGRGRGPSEYIGNKHFRRLVKSRKEKYTSMKATIGKHMIAKGLFLEIKSRGGRFLKLVRNTSAKKPPRSVVQKGVWSEVAPSTAVEKCKQLLREKQVKKRAGSVCLENKISLSSAPATRPTPGGISRAATDGIPPKESAPTSVEWGSSMHPSTGLESLNPSTNLPRTLLQSAGHAIDSSHLVPFDSNPRNSVRHKLMTKQQAALNIVYPNQFRHAHRPQNGIMPLQVAGYTAPAATLSRATLHGLYERYLENRIFQSVLHDALRGCAQSGFEQQTRNCQYLSRSNLTNPLVNSSFASELDRTEAAFGMFALKLDYRT